MFMLAFALTLCLLAWVGCVAYVSKPKGTKKTKLRNSRRESESEREREEKKERTVPRVKQ